MYKFNPIIYLVISLFLVGTSFAEPAAQLTAQPSAQTASQPTSQAATPSPAPAPFKNPAINTIYNLLFCDNPALFQQQLGGKLNPPWNVIFAEVKEKPKLERIVNSLSYDSRTKILAYNELTRMGVKNEPRELLGIVVEVGLADGVDVLAVYKDGTARYINWSGKAIIWQKQDEIVDRSIALMLDRGEELLSKKEPQNKERLPLPKNGDIQLTFLTSQGLYSVTGDFDHLSEDPLDGPVIRKSTELMAMLIAKTFTRETMR